MAMMWLNLGNVKSICKCKIKLFHFTQYLLMHKLLINTPLFCNSKGVCQNVSKHLAPSMSIVYGKFG